jgi:hypothetical protein
VKRMDIKVLAAALALAASTGHLYAADPKGAKAIFDSGEGSSIAMSAGAPRPAAPAAAPMTPTQQKFVGISYQIMTVSDDGQMRAVSKSRVFRSGERAKIVVRTNRPGYLTVMNIGPTGNTAILFNEFVEPFRMVEVPRASNLRFVGDPGTERVLFMLSNDPNPMATQVNSAPPPAPNTAYVPAPAPAPSAAYTPPPAPSPSYAPAPVAVAENLPPPPPMPTMVASIEGAKNLKGSKDIVAEDSMQSTYSVVSANSGWKPRKAGMKDLVVESEAGVNYGVIPVAAMSGGGILTLEVKLTHR